jgi:hypothetical protein
VVVDAMTETVDPWKSIRKCEGRIGFVEVRKDLVDGKWELEE